MIYSKLKILLDERNLLEEEKNMWLRIGIYVTSEPYTKTTTLTRHLKIYDAVGNYVEVSSAMGTNIRQSVLAWWQVERVKPRAKELVADATGLTDLENRNAT